MRALALLGPTATDDDVAPFRLPGVELDIAQHVGTADAALVFGGDGTVHRHLPALNQTQTPLLVVPAGSGNDFARALGLRSAAQALETWRGFVAGKIQPHSVDLGTIVSSVASEPVVARAPRSRADRGDETSRAGESPASTQASTPSHLFCCVGGAGLDADANRRANAQPRWLRAHGGYLLAIAQAFLALRRTRARVVAVSVEGETLLDFEEPAALVAFANAPSYGGGLRIAPAARLDDGKLELVFVRARNRFVLAWKARKLRTGEHIGLPEIEYARIARMTLACDPPREVYADGEYVGRTPIEVSVLPRALRVITPAIV